MGCASSLDSLKDDLAALDGDDNGAVVVKNNEKQHGNKDGAVSTDGDFDSDEEEDFDRSDFQQRVVHGEMSEEEKKEMEELGFVCAPPRFNASMAWRGAIHAPSNPPENIVEAPKEELELEWVYGFRCDDTRDVIRVLPDGRIVYPTAGVLVVYDWQEHKQTFFREHNDDIVSIAQNPADPWVIASGQVATIENGHSADPSVYIWNVKTDEKTKIKKAVKKSCRALAFSPSGKYLAAAGMDQSVTISVFDVKTGEKLASESADSLPHKVFTLSWTSDNHFVSSGVGHLFNWEFSGSSLKKSRVPGGTNVTNSYSAATDQHGNVLLATKSGKVHTIKSDGPADKGTSHGNKGPLFSIVPTKDGYITGGKDKHVYVHGKNSHSFKVSGVVRSLAVIGCKLFIGCKDGSISYVHDYEYQPVEPKVIHQGHFDGELWALDIDNKDNSVAYSAGEDNTLQAINLDEHKVTTRSVLTSEKCKKRRRVRAATTSSFAPAKCARGVAVSPNGSQLAVGSNDGFLSVYNANTLERTHHVNLNNSAKMKVDVKRDNWISSLKFSPDGKSLAVGTHGCVIALCDATDGFKVKGVLKAHNAAVIHVDWSADGTAIQSNCGAYELLFHDIDQNNLKNSKQNPSSSQFKDTEWATMTCKMGWAVNGIWDADRQKGSDVNCVDCRPDLKLVASGNDEGEVCLFRYPVGDNNDRKRFDGHSSHVMNVRFTRDGKRLLSAGGNDKSIFQWKVVG